MITLLTCFLNFVFGFWNKPPKHKSQRPVRCIYFLWCFDSNLECHLNIEVRNCFLFLSCLCALLTSSHAHSQQSLTELQNILKRMKTQFKNSDALLYTPPAEVKCSQTFMYCYLLELDVILNEENGLDSDLNHIYNLKKEYSSSSNCSKSCCRQCEEFPKANSTVFSEMMEKFIMKLLSQKK